MEGKFFLEALLTMNISKCLCAQLISKNHISFLVKHRIKLYIIKILSMHTILDDLQLFPSLLLGNFPRKGLNLADLGSDLSTAEHSMFYREWRKNTLFMDKFDPDANV